MKPILTSAAVMLLASAAWAAPSMSGFVARMPVFPATTQAAGAAFGGSVMDAPVPPRAIADLEHALTDMNMQMAAANAPTAAQQQAGINTSQDIAAKMQSMTQEQRIAYAMQLQANMARPAPMALDANGVRDARAAGAIAQQAPADAQALNGLRSRVQALTSNWQIEDQKITRGDFMRRLCTAADRANNTAWLGPHLALARANLTQGAALEKELRAFANGQAAKNAQAEALSGPGAAPARNGTRSNVQQAIMAMIDLYDAAGRAAKYQHASDWNAQAPITGPCRDDAS